jgi:selenocysteine-specific elongation factor
MTRLLLGVIGHVDHGKTALVRALTGMETDRLAEERKRGISIVLGFAHMAIGGAVVDLIDTPGHERFVRTMVAGATGMDAVLLVVAANEGIKPQTVEHVGIAGLLGLRGAVIAVTKADLATPDEVAAAGRAAAALVAAAGLRAGPPVPVAAPDGSGIDALRAAIADMLAAIPAPGDDGVAYLPVDRAFSLAGHGTVVTGTLRRGRLAPDAALEVVPGGVPARVRGLQVHGAAVQAADPGQRVAVNLRGLEPAQVPRGAALAAAGLLRPAVWLSVRLRALDEPVLDGARLRLLFGTAETEARLRLLDREVLQPGATAMAQLKCAEPAALPAREAFVLRAASPPRTLAGGVVLDPEAVRLRRGVASAVARLAALGAADAAGVIAHEVAAAGISGARVERVARIAGVSPARAASLLAGQPVLPARGGMVVSRAAFEALLARLPKLIAARAAAEPRGISREGLQALLPLAGPEVLEAAVARLVGAGMLRQEGGRVRIADAAAERARGAAEAAMAERLAEALRRGGLTPPDTAPLAGDAAARRAVEALVRAGVLVRAHDSGQKRDVLFHRDAIEAARRRLRPLLADPPGMLVRDIGAALGISRKFCVPLLEHLDAIRFTRRVNDRRVLAQPG